MLMDALEQFLEDDKQQNKSMGVHQKPEQLPDNLDGRPQSSAFTFVPTEDLLANSRRQAEGIWYKGHAKGYLV